MDFRRCGGGEDCTGEGEDGGLDSTGASEDIAGASSGVDVGIIGSDLVGEFGDEEASLFLVIAFSESQLRRLRFVAGASGAMAGFLNREYVLIGFLETLVQRNL